MAVAIRTLVVAAALALALATPVAAQELSGTVQYIDLGSNTIHFTDGQVVHLKPGAQITINGQPVEISALTPGTPVIVRTGETRTSGATTSVAPSAGDTRFTSTTPMHPPVNASGVVSNVDARGKTITFQDGRVMQVSDGTVWQAVPLHSLKPGQQVFINDARPVAFQQHRMNTTDRLGTVSRVDQSGSLLVLHDGTVVRLQPGTTVSMGNQRLAISNLRPGDEVLIRIDEPRAASVVAPSAQSSSTIVHESSGSALPRDVVRGDSFGTSSLTAREVLIFRRPQSP
jgi:hypothetical protein